MFHLTIPASRLPDVERLVLRFARKAPKLGLKPPTLTASEPWPRLWVVNDRGREVAGPFDRVLPYVFPPEVATVETLMVDVTIEGERPVLAGWSFQATLEHTPAGNILRKMPGVEGDLPEQFRALAPRCDHCALRRMRKDTFVLRHEESGEWKQVGRSCLQDHLANTDPAAWLAFAEFERSLAGLDFGGDGGFGGARVSDPAVPAFLAAVVRHIKDFGWVSGAQARDRMKYSTAQEVRAVLTIPPSSRHFEERVRFMRTITDHDRATAQSAIEWALGSTDRSDYAHNLRMAVQTPSIGRNAGLLASLIPSFDRSIIPDPVQRLNEHLPDVEPGEEIDLDLTLHEVKSIASDYGSSDRMTFLDDAGRTVVWWCRKDLDVVPGQVLRLRGRVKALDVWNGQAQTTIKNVRILPFI